MSNIKLKRLVKKDWSDVVDILMDLSGQSITIYDSDDTVLKGDASLPGDRFPIHLGEQTLGWVGGRSAAEAVAKLLSYLVVQSSENRAIANEVLDKYREINLLYSLASKLSACREVAAVTHLALEEAYRLIEGNSAVLILVNDDRKTMTTAHTLGNKLLVEPVTEVGQGITGFVAATGKSEVINHVPSDERYKSPEIPIQAMLCAPIQSQDKVIGMIAIHSSKSINYSASDLKLLTAIALQSAPALEHALFHQQEMQAALERENRLQEEIHELRIEINEVKRQQQVKEVTESEFFRSLKDKAAKLRKRPKTDDRP